MSYVSSFVQAPAAKIVATESKAAEKAPLAKATVKNETTTKILLFVAIIACIATAMAI